MDENIYKPPESELVSSAAFDPEEGEFYVV